MLEKEYLKKLEQSIKTDSSKTVLRRALTKGNLQDVAYILEEEQNTQFNFSVNIETLPVANQMRSGRCWIFSGLNFLREITAKKLKLTEFEFSQNYIAFYDKLEKINFFFESVLDFLDAEVDDRTLQFLLNQGIQDGGQWAMLQNLIEKYGLVPKSAMPETTSSSNTGLMNEIINVRLRKYAADVRRAHQESRDSDIEKIREVATQELYNFLVTNFGMPPQKFNFEYTDKNKKYHIAHNLTPQKFYDKYVGLNLNQYVSVINSPTKDKSFLKTYTISYLGNVVEGNKVVHLNLPIDRLKEVTIAQLKDTEPVWFGSDVSLFGDRTHGVWDDRMFDFEQIFDINVTLDKETQLDYRASAMNHAMLLTGVNLVDGKPNKWKIENSWGDKVGSKGYYLCTDTWFDRYTYQVLINKKYLNEAELKALESEPTVLKPWDPMGTLAR